MLLFLFGQGPLAAQSFYSVEKTSFSTNKYDEFSPILFQNQIVYCSNQSHDILISYADASGAALFNIFSIERVNDSSSVSSNPKIFSKALVSPYNDGPVSFYGDSLLVYSRNLDIKSRTKNIFDPNNNLGLFFAKFTDGKWMLTDPYPYNNEEYSITTPCFSPDGSVLYFASDKPGGYGGTDLYRSVKNPNGEWTEPENLGAGINTKGNEVYPFMSENGDLFFASDGLEGMGKKDIYISRAKDGEWTEAINLMPPINSPDDDFALITNAEFREGYFSSNRAKSDDIYSFSTNIPLLIDCDTMLENNYCFEFWDEEYASIDTLPVTYEWEFSDGIKIRGLRVEHCLPGAGFHWAKLNIIDNSTSNTFFTQASLEFNLEDHVQPFIESPDALLKDKAVNFSALKSYLPDFSIEGYAWDFGDGNYAVEAEVDHSYKKVGEYTIKLGVTGRDIFTQKLETKCVIKELTVLKDNQSLALLKSGMDPQDIIAMKEPEGGSGKIKQDFSVFEVDPTEAAFRVEVLSSPEKITLEDTIFAPLREDYEIREFYLSEDSLYSYTVGEYASLLSSYEVYSDVIQKGFTKAQVKTYVLAELPTEIIARINTDFAEFADANFEFNQSEVSENSYHILDRVAEIMKENPELVMEIAAHTDNVGSFEFNMDLSQKRAESIVKYLTLKGIESTRLIGKGYGESRPIASNSTEEGRLKNRRVEFIILNE